MIRFAEAEVPVVVNDEKQILRFKVSDESQDRYGDRIAVRGWTTKNYLKNPVLLVGHVYSDPTAPSVGKALQIDTEKDGLYIDYEFAPASVNPMASLMYKTYRGGYQRAVSVGFQPDESRMVIPKDEAERESLGLGPRGIYYKGQDLLEVSLVTVPANPNAVQMAVKKGCLTVEEAGRLESLYGEFYVKMISWAEQQKKSAPSQDSGLVVKIQALHDEVRGLATKVENLGKADGGRPNSSSGANPEDEANYGAGLYAKVFSLTEELGKNINALTPK